MNVNLKGVFFCCQQAALLMGDSGGAIVNISSGTSTQTTPGRAPYVISKGGVNAMTAVLASEWAEDRNGKKAIRVNAVAPGTTVTNNEKRPAHVLESFRLMGALPELNTAEKIAPAVLFLASGESDGITGETLAVDGGCVQIRMPEKLYESPILL